MESCIEPYWIIYVISNYISLCNIVLFYFMLYIMLFVPFLHKLLSKITGYLMVCDSFSWMRTLCVWCLGWLTWSSAIPWKMLRMLGICKGCYIVPTHLLWAMHLQTKQIISDSNQLQVSMVSGTAQRCVWHRAHRQQQRLCHLFFKSSTRR